MKADVLIPNKSTTKTRQMTEDYIKGEGRRVRRYTLSTSTEEKKRKKRYSQELYLIFYAKNDYSLIDIKRKFQKGKLTLKDSMKLIYVMMTTQRPKNKQSSWPSRTFNFYKKRWAIETGFSDLNRIARRWKSSHDNSRYLDLFVRMLLYNSWKMNRMLFEKNQNKRFKNQRWTLENNQDVLAALFLEV
jgi:hypothetical protein